MTFQVAYVPVETRLEGGRLSQKELHDKNFFGRIHQVKIIVGSVAHPIKYIFDTIFGYYYQRHKNLKLSGQQLLMRKNFQDEARKYTSRDI